MQTPPGRPGRNASRILAAILALLSLCVNAQDGELQPKAQKLYQALLAKPFSEILSERFMSAFLEEASFEELEKFLSSKTEPGSDSAPANAAILASAYESEGRDDKALLWHEKALELKPDWPEAMLAKASLLMRLGKFKDASAELERALKLDMTEETKAKAAKTLGRAYAKAGDAPKAIETWTSLSKERPDDFDLAEETLEIEIEEGLFDEAAGTCSKLIGSAPSEFKRTALLLRLGDIYGMKGERQKAVETYTSALDKAGSGSWLEREILSQIEMALRAEDGLPELISSYDAILAKNPGRVEVARRKAMLLLERGDSQKAIDALAELVKATPGDKANKELLASALDKSGKSEDALSILSALCPQFPNDPELPLKKASIESALKKNGDCVADIKEYVRRSKNSEYSFMRAAKLLCSYGMDKEAEALYGELVAAYPESVEAAEARAAFLHSAGKTAEAAESLRKLASSGTLESLLRLSKALCSIKEREKALETLMAKEAQFGSDFKYLEEISSLCSSLGRKEEACEAALKMLRSSGDPQEMSRAVTVAAMALKAAGNFDAFRSSLEAKSPRSEQETCLLAEMQLQTAEAGKALATLDGALASSQNSLPLLTARLQACRKAGRTDESIATLKRIMDAQPNKSSWCLRELAETCLKAGLHSEALSWTEKWRKSSPGVAAPSLLEARILQDSGEWRKASEILVKAWRKFPDDREIPRSLAQCLSANGDYAAAAAVWWRVMDSEQELSGQLSAVGELTQISMLSGETDSLVRRLRSRMESNPKSAFPPLALAEVFRHSGNYEERRNLLLKVSDMKGDDPALLHEVARMEEEEGDYEKAISSMRRAAAADKTDRSKRLLSQLLFRTGDPDAGFQMLYELAGGDSMPPESAAETAVSLLISGNASKASEFLAPFLKLHPGNPELNFAAALASEEAGNSKEAVAKWLSLVDIPDFQQRQGKPQAPSIASNRANFISGADKLPGEALKILESQSNSFTAYQYKDTIRQSMHFRRVMPGQPASSYMPQDADTIRKYALAHLAALSTSMGKDERNDLIQTLTSKGVAYAGLKMLPPRRNSPYGLPDSGTLSIMRAATPEDEVIASLWAISLALPSSGRAKAKESDIEEAMKLFKDKNPSLALSIFCAAMSQRQGAPPTVSAKMLEEALELMEKASDLSAFPYLASLLSSPKLPAEMKTSIKERLLAWADTAPYAARQGIFTPLAKELIADGDYGKFAAFLQKEIDTAAAQPAAKQPAIHYTGRFSGTRFMMPYGASMLMGMNADGSVLFPPQQLACLPPEALAILRLLAQGSDEETEDEFGMPPGTRLKFDAERLWEACRNLKPPAALLILAEACRKKEEASRLAASMLANPARSFPDCMIVASWSAFRKDLPGAASAISEALKLTPDKDELKTGYAMLIQLAANPDSGKELAKAAAAAAERLMALGLSREEKAFLAQSLESIGLEKEAEAIDRSLAQSATTRAAAATTRRLPIRTARTSRQKQPVEEAQAAFKRGDADEGVKLAAKEFRRLFKSNSSFSVSNPYPNLIVEENAFQQVKSSVQEASATDAFLKEMAPKAGAASAANFLEFAFALELFNRDPEAEKAYSDILAKEPANKVANLRLALLLATKDQERAASCISKLGSMDFSLMHSIMVHFLNDRDIERRIASIPLATRMVESQPDDSSGGSFSMMTNLFQMLEQPIYYRNSSLPGVFSKPIPAKTDMGLFNRRRDAFLALCDSCIKNPGLSELGFQRKLMLLESENSPPDETLYRQAVDILKTSTATLQSWQYQMFNRQSKAIPQCAEDFAIGYASANGRLQELKSLAASLPEQRRNSLLKKISIRSALMECPEGDFLKILETMSAQEAGQPGTDGWSLPDFAFRTAMEAMRQRKLECSLTPLAVKTLAAAAGSQSGVQRLAPSLWARNLAETGRDEELSGYFKAALDALFPEAAVKEAKAAALSPYSGQSLYNKTAAFSQIVSAASSVNPKTVFCAFDAIADSKGAQFLMQSRRANAYEIVQCASEITSSIDSLEPLKGSALLRDFDGFNPYPLPGDDNSVLLNLVQSLRHGDRKDRILKELDAVSPRTFGSKLIATLIRAEAKDTVFDFLTDELPQIKAASEERRKGFLSALYGVLPRIGLSESASAQRHAELQALIDGSVSEAASSGFDAFMASSITDHDVWEYSERAASIISALAISQPDKAEAALNQAVKKVKAFQLRNSVSYASGQQDHALNSLFERLSSEMKDPKLFAILLKYPELPPSAMPSIFNRFDELFSREVNSRFKGMPSHDSPSRAAAIKEALSAFAVDCQPVQQPPPIARALSNFAQGLNPEDIDKLVKDIRASDGAASSPVMKEAAAILERIASLKTKSTPPESFVSYAKELMSDPKSLPALKLRIFSSCAKLFTGAPELDPVIEDASKMLLELYFKSPQEAAESTDEVLDALSSSKLPTDKLKSLAPPIIAAWLNASSPSNPNRVYLNMNVASKALAICVKTDDEACAANLLASPDIKLKEQASTYIMLLNGGKPALCSGTFLKNWQDIAPSKPNSKLTSEGAKAASGMIDSIDDPELKLLAEALLRIPAQDEKAEAAASALPARFLKTDFKNKEMRAKTLSLILSEQNSRQVQSLLPELCAGITPAQLIGDRNGVMRSAYSRLMRSLLDRGDFAQYSAKCKELAAAAPSRHDNSDNNAYYNARNLFQQLARELMSFLLSPPSKSPAQTKKIPPSELLQTLSILIDNTEPGGKGEMEVIYATAFLLHSAAGTPDNLKEWTGKAQGKDGIQPPDECRQAVQILSKCVEKEAMPSVLEQACLRLQDAYPKTDRQRLDKFKSALMLAALESADSFDGLKSLASSLPPDSPLPKEMESLLTKITENHFLSQIKDRKSIDKSDPEVARAAFATLKEISSLPDCFRDETYFAFDRLAMQLRNPKNCAATFLLLKSGADALPEDFRNYAEFYLRAKLLNSNLVDENMEESLSKLDSYLANLAADRRFTPKFKARAFCSVSHLLLPQPLRHAPSYTGFMLLSKDSTAFMDCVNALDACPESEEWRTAALSLCKAWKESESKKLSFDSRRMAILLDLHLRVNDMEGANAILSDAKRNVFRDPFTYISLLRHNKNELSAGAFMKHWSELNASFSIPASNFTSPDIIENSIAASKGLPQELSLLFRAMAAVWRYENTPSDKRQEECAPALESVIGEFKTTEFKDSTIKDKMLKMFRSVQDVRAGKLKGSEGLKDGSAARKKPK